mmetsp:Transcript_4233/g.6258  ORF Transcript_4233/g.6258 Transcript_4233/m.6258 type:complete len:151 (+) Transcript_4233:168-620(+)
MGQNRAKVRNTKSELLIKKNAKRFDQRKLVEASGILLKLRVSPDKKDFVRSQEKGAKSLQESQSTSQIHQVSLRDTLTGPDDRAYKYLSDAVLQEALNVLMTSNSVRISNSVNSAALDATVERILKKQCLRRLYFAGWNRRYFQGNSCKK